MNISGERLRKIREARGYSQKYVAKQAGIHEVLYRRYEYGERSPSEDTLQKIASVLGVVPAVLESNQTKIFSALSAFLYDFSEQCYGNLDIKEIDGSYYVGVKARNEHGKWAEHQWDTALQIAQKKIKELSPEEFQTWLLLCPPSWTIFEIVKEKIKKDHPSDSQDPRDLD